MITNRCDSRWVLTANNEIDDDHRSVDNEYCNSRACNDQQRTNQSFLESGNSDQSSSLNSSESENDDANSNGCLDEYDSDTSSNHSSSSDELNYENRGKNHYNERLIETHNDYFSTSESESDEQVRTCGKKLLLKNIFTNRSFITQ